MEMEQWQGYKTTTPSLQARSGKSQVAVNDNALDHKAPRAGPQWSNDSEQSVAMSWTAWPSGQALNGGRQLAVSGNALDHTATRTGPSVVE